MGAHESRDKSEAVLVYLGTGIRACHPSSSTQAVLERFGSEEGPGLVTYVERVVDELSKIEINWSRTGMQEAIVQVVDQVKRTYPELDETAAQALGSAFSYWWK